MCRVGIKGVPLLDEFVFVGLTHRVMIMIINDGLMGCYLPRPSIDGPLQCY